MKKSNKKTLVLTRNDIELIINTNGLDAVMDELISRITSAFIKYNPEQTVIPIRSGFNYEDPNTGLVEWMPVYQKGGQVVIKLVGYHPKNPDKQALPTILSTVSAYDTATGHLVGIMDGVLLTALRTGATSAMASKFLSSPESTTLGLIGCGAQAVTQLHAISRIFDIKKVLIYDIDEDTMMSFEKRCNVLGLNIDIILTDITQVVSQSDILCTATSIETGEGPLFEYGKIKSHVHINAIGSDFPGKTELPLALLKQSFVCPDFPEQAMIEGECQQLESSEIGTCLSDISKDPESFLHVQNKRSVFDSTGWALEDQVAMDMFMEYARKLGLGQEMDIELVTDDAKNPYHTIKNRASKKMITVDN